MSTHDGMRGRPVESRADRWMRHYAVLSAQASAAAPSTPRQRAPREPIWPAAWTMPQGWSTTRLTGGKTPLTPRANTSQSVQPLSSARGQARDKRVLEREGVEMNTQSQVGRLSDMRARGPSGTVLFMQPCEYARFLQRDVQDVRAPYSQADSQAMPRGRWRQPESNPGQSTALEFQRREQESAAGSSEPQRRLAAATAQQRERERYQREQERLGDFAYGSQLALHARRKQARPMPPHFSRYHRLMASAGAPFTAIDYRWQGNAGDQRLDSARSIHGLRTPRSANARRLQVVSGASSSSPSVPDVGRTVVTI